MIQWGLVLLFFALDQASKRWALNALAGGSKDWGLFALTLVQNKGAAFGLGQKFSALFAVLAGVFLLLGLLLLLLRTPKNVPAR